MTLSRCTYCRVTVSVPFVNVKTEAIALATPPIFANCVENSDDILRCILFLTPVSCISSNRKFTSGDNGCYYQPCYLWRHKQTLSGVIRPVAGGKMPNVSLGRQKILFSWTSLLSLRVLHSGFLLYIVFLSGHIVLKLYSF